MCRFLQKKKAPQCKERKGRSGFVFLPSSLALLGLASGRDWLFFANRFFALFFAFLGSRGGSTAADFDWLDRRTRRFFSFELQ